MNNPLTIPLDQVRDPAEESPTQSGVLGEISVMAALDLTNIKTISVMEQTSSVPESNKDRFNRSQLVIEYMEPLHKARY